MAQIESTDVNNSMDPALKRRYVHHKKRKRHFIKGAIKHPGALHKDLKVPEGKKIPHAAMAEAAKHGGKTAQRARFALMLSKLNK